MFGPLAAVLCGLLDLWFPEHCAWCGTLRRDGGWMAPGNPVEGLRPWDQPHTCANCAARLSRTPAVRQDLGSGMTVWGGMRTEASLVEVIGRWKYHGVRGLAWPLSHLLGNAAAFAASCGIKPGVLVPIPLHRRRRRERGFNQAELLAELMAAATNWRSCPGLLRRQSQTAQQAKIPDPRQRWHNVADAFAAGVDFSEGVRAYLVDDVVTSGATVLAAAATLRKAGVRVEGAFCLGLAGKATRVKDHRGEVPGAPNLMNGGPVDRDLVPS